MAPNPANTILALGCEDGSVRLVDIASDGFMHLRRFDRIKCRILSLAWGPPVPPNLKEARNGSESSDDEDESGDENDDDDGEQWDPKQNSWTIEKSEDDEGSLSCEMKFHPLIWPSHGKTAVMLVDRVEGNGVGSIGK